MILLFSRVGGTGRHTPSWLPTTLMTVILTIYMRLLWRLLDIKPEPNICKPQWLIPNWWTWTWINVRLNLEKKTCGGPWHSWHMPEKVSGTGCCCCGIVVRPTEPVIVSLGIKCGDRTTSCWPSVDRSKEGGPVEQSVMSNAPEHTPITGGVVVVVVTVTWDIMKWALQRKSFIIIASYGWRYTCREEEQTVTPGYGVLSSLRYNDYTHHLACLKKDPLWNVQPVKQSLHHIVFWGTHQSTTQADYCLNVVIRRDLALSWMKAKGITDA